MRRKTGSKMKGAIRSKKCIAMLAISAMALGLLAGCGETADTDNADKTTAESGETAGEGTDEEASAGSWDAAHEISILSREDGSGTRGAFIELFGIEEKQGDEKVDMTTDDAQITNSTAVMKTTVAGDPYAIGYISLGVLDDTVKAVKIDGAEATAEGVKDGTYKVSRPFHIATRSDSENEVAEDFIRFILSTEGQAIVADNGYIPMDDTERFTSKQPAGKAVVGGSSSVSPLMEKLIEGYAGYNPDAELELQTSDSTTGMTSTIEGSYDIGMASRELKDEELSGGLTPQVIATDGIAVIVNNESDVEELTSEQVKEIYTGGASVWDEVIDQ